MAVFRTTLPGNGAEDSVMTNGLFKWVTPNQLTLGRIAVIPGLLLLIYVDNPVTEFLAVVVFFLACMTDYWDGYLARFRDQVSRFGRMMDPVADKMLISASLVMLVSMGRADAIPTILIILREFAVSAMRQVAVADGVIISAKASAKWKTVLQMIAVGLLLIGHEPFSIPFLQAGRIVLWVAAVWTLWTGFTYLRDHFKNTPSS